MIFKNWTFWKFDSKDWTFESVTQSTEPFFFNMSQRIEPTFPIWLKELIFFFWIWLKELIFFLILTQRIQFLNSFTNMAYSKSSTHLNLFIWLNELDLFYMTQRIEPYWIITQRIEPFFFSWLKELNLFFECDAKNWTFFFEETQWIEYFLWSKELYFLCWMWSKELNLFCWMWPKELNHCWITWRSDLFYKMTENWTLFEPFHMTRRNEHFLKWLKELNLFECDSKNWNFSIWHALNISFLEYDAQNWTSLFSNMTHRIEHLFSRIWRTELNISFLEYDSQNFLQMTHRTEHLFLQMTHRTEHLFLQMTQRIDFF